MRSQPGERREWAMNFLEHIFENLERSTAQPVLREARADGAVSVTGAELLAQVAQAREFIREAGFSSGDRCALLAPNGIRWAALDLALMAEGIVTVPLYARQAPVELAAMLRDAQPRAIFCGDAALREAISAAWPEAPRRILFEEVFSSGGSPSAGPPLSRSSADPLTIIYTSGTSGEAKGVILNVGNLDHIVGCTTSRLDVLMGKTTQPDRVFHYLPFCFAGSWILLLSCLSRSSVLTLSMDLSRLAAELGEAQPDYCLNVPTLLERMRSSIEDSLRKRSGLILRMFERGRSAWLARREGRTGLGDALWLAAARAVVFRAIRKKLGANLRALICGSAPLALDTQLFFVMLGLPVLQVYGLTETTGICTMDHPAHFEPGWVGPAVPGIEMKLGENDEIVVRGPNVFPGYWNRPDETAKVLRDGWFHSGDQGEVNANGNWRIVGRIKNLIILNSGHNIAPEPIEEELRAAIPGAEQVVLLGNGRGYLAAIVAGKVERARAESAFEKVNANLPHYKQIRMFHVEQSALTIESGLLTANGKLKRNAIAEHFAGEIAAMYQRKAG
jgi:long-chain acyl-CoA synthetase